MSAISAPLTTKGRNAPVFLFASGLKIGNFTLTHSIPMAEVHSDFLGALGNTERFSRYAFGLCERDLSRGWTKYHTAPPLLAR
jgi:hypothetical protein